MTTQRRGQRRPKVRPPRGSLFPARRGARWGFIDATGEVAIPFRFRSVGAFSEGLALAETAERRCGFLDAAGDWVVQPDFTPDPTRLDVLRFHDGLAPVRVGKREFDFVTSAGARLGKAFDDVTPFSERLAFVQRGDGWGFIDERGDFVIEPKLLPAHEGLAPLSAFSDGCALVRTSDDEASFNFIEPDGELLLEDGLFDAFPFREGLAAVCRDPMRGWRLMTREVGWAFKPPFHLSALGGVREGLVDFQRDHEPLTGFLSVKGEVVIEPRFDGALGFSEGLCAVRVADRWGFIDAQGQFVIEPRFALAQDFHDGLAWVRGDDWEGYVSRAGVVVFDGRE